MKQHNYYVYILTNISRSTIYVGVTSNLQNRVCQHIEGQSKFTAKYKCHHLIYFEHYKMIQHAIDREKQLKKWNRTKKLNLARTKNPYLSFLTEELFEGDLV